MSESIHDKPNVVSLPIKPKPSHKSIELVNAQQLGKCQHHHVEVDETLALLTCLDCKERLDPISYIVGVAKKIRGWDYEHERIVTARKLLSERQATKCTFCGKMTRIRL